MTTPAQVLKKARELISDEKAWTKEADARTAEGWPTDVSNPKAVCFCMEGALLRVDPMDFESWDFLASAIGTQHLSVWNDDGRRAHAEVLAAFDKAIALAEGGGE